MAKGVNKVLLLGNVGKDPEIRSTAGGMTIATFSLATADRQKDQQGTWQDKTEWHNLVAFQRTAEIVRDYVKKGSQLYIEGKIQTRSWDDKESGQKRSKLRVVCEHMQMLGSRGEGGGGGGGGGSRGGGRPAQAPSGGGEDFGSSGPDYDSGGGGDIPDDEVPF